MTNPLRIRKKDIEVITDLYGASLFPKQIIVLHLARKVFGERYMERILGMDFWWAVNIYSYTPFSVPLSLALYVLFDGEIDIQDICIRWSQFVRTYKSLLPG
jgi:hypothetical protein